MIAYANTPNRCFIQLGVSATMFASIPTPAAIANRRPESNLPRSILSSPPSSSAGIACRIDNGMPSARASRFPVPPAKTPTRASLRHGARDLHHRTIPAEREQRVVMRRVLYRELRRVAWPLGEHDVAVNRAARQRFSCLFGESLALSRRRIGDDDCASNQKRHTCENEKLKFGGGDESPTRFWPPEHARLSVEGS